MSDAPLTLVWIDLEMTGLDPERCTIIEIGVILTGADLVPRAQLERAIWQPEEMLARMDPFVRDMHTRNGLLERVRKSSTALRDAEAEAVALISKHCAFGEGILAGNSVHVDRTFLNRYMPMLAGFLHYRQVDVSTLKVLTRAWYPGATGYEKEDKAHTVLADLRESIAELRHYRSVFFRQG